MNEIKICDNFLNLKEVKDVRAVVAGRGFTTETGPDGAEYTGICEYPMPSWENKIEDFLDCAIVPHLSCFRLNLKGEFPHSWVHSDHICAKYASVLYLNLPEQCLGGTAFWKHTALHIDRMPTKAELINVGTHPGWFYGMMEREWKDLAYWEKYADVAMSSGRFVTYPTELFHSRYPFEAFGEGPQDGRLIWICFYDKVAQ